MSNDDKEQPAVLSWRFIALGACGIVTTLGWWAIGIWAESLDARLDAITKIQGQQWELIQQRASLAPRLDAVERWTADQEQRLREVERQSWRKH